MREGTSERDRRKEYDFKIRQDAQDFTDTPSWVGMAPRHSYKKLELTKGGMLGQGEGTNITRNMKSKVLQRQWWWATTGSKALLGL